jgi:hypothetical protein
MSFLQLLQVDAEAPRLQHSPDHFTTFSSLVTTKAIKVVMTCHYNNTSNQRSATPSQTIPEIIEAPEPHTTAVRFTLSIKE